MKILATFGPIAVFNISEFRSDDFIVDNNDIRLFSLPLLTSTHVKAFTLRFLSAVDNVSHIKVYAEARCELEKMLQWLWDVAIGPVLDELGLPQAGLSNEILPRVWWAGSGLLNILPIHAAGYHQAGSIRNAEFTSRNMQTSR